MEKQSEYGRGKTTRMFYSMDTWLIDRFLKVKSQTFIGSKCEELKLKNLYTLHIKVCLHDLGRTTTYSKKLLWLQRVL